MPRMPTIDELIARAEFLAEEHKRLAADLKTYRRLQKQSGKAPELKYADGKLTDEGVRVLEAGFKAGRSPSDIARSLGITVPAVLYRKRTWEADQ